MKTTHLHPRWTGNLDDGYDVALLQLPQEIDVMTPALADEGLQIIPNLHMYALRFGAVLEIAEFVTVRKELCPNMSSLGPGTFCAYSEWASMRLGTLRYHVVPRLKW